MKNRNFIESIKCAVKGLRLALMNERNLRFDASVMCTVVFFALFYGISRTQWALLVMIFSLVIGAELFNTALEKAVDAAVREYNPTAGAAKDISAAAVLVCAICAAVSGIIIFGDVGKIYEALVKIFQNPLYAFIFCALIAADTVLIFVKTKRS